MWQFVPLASPFLYISSVTDLYSSSTIAMVIYASHFILVVLGEEVVLDD